MSDILHEDTFHGTKKGMRRKTVSKRRAYVKGKVIMSGSVNRRLGKILTLLHEAKDVKGMTGQNLIQKTITEVIILRNELLKEAR